MVPIMTKFLSYSVLVLFTIMAVAQESAITEEQTAFFEEKVKPVLLENCISCHGADKQKGALRLDIAEAFLKGGETGPAIVAGDADASLLVRAIEHTGDLKMPPKRKLPDDEIATLKQWIADGAAWPEGNEIKRPESDKKLISASAAKMEAKSTKKGDEKPIILSKLELRDVGEGDIDFNRDIRPILSENCFTCHGPDEQTIKAGLRLDLEEEALKALSSGEHAIVPGDAESSLLIARMITDDPDDRMPPVDLGKTITQEQIDLLTRWINQGAEWSGHWSFNKPEKSSLPEVSRPEWTNNEIDYFVLSKLDKEGLTPQEEADKRTLIRRASLDLTGLPPTLDEINGFLSDTSDNAFEKVVDRLLDSPHYGEHMARYWLDASRYADTNGYHIDNERYMWLWRDWVIDAYNENKPFDEFTIDQLAGDLHPEPTQDQRIATGFNRNHMINFEGGAIPEEYYNAYIVDRVTTFGTIWLGLTVNCAQCHDHKYDPFTMRDFYQLYSFFNNVEENGLDGRTGNAVPLIKVPSEEQNERLAALTESITQTKKDLNGPMPTVDEKQVAWEAKLRDAIQNRWEQGVVQEATSSADTPFAILDDNSVLAGGASPAKDVYTVKFPTELQGITALKLEALLDDSLPKQGPGRAPNNNFVLSEIELELAPADDPENFTTIKLNRANADYAQPDFDVSRAIDGNPDTGWGILREENAKPESRTAVFIPAQPVGFPGGSIARVRLRHESPHGGHGIGRFRLSLSNDIALTPANFGTWYSNGPFQAENGDEAYDTAYDPEQQDLGKAPDLEALTDDGRWKWVPAPHIKDGRVEPLPGDKSAIYLYRYIRTTSPREMVLSLGSNDAIKVWLNGSVVLDQKVQRGAAPDQDRVTLALEKGENQLYIKVVDYGGQHAIYFRNAQEQFGEVPFSIEAILASSSKPTAKQKRELRNFYREKFSPEWKAMGVELAKLEKEKTDVEAAIPTTMVMEEMATPKPMTVLTRGEYDRPGEAVDTLTPSALHQLPDGATNNRMGLAQWVVSRENPLTSRVVVNRLWQRFFGIGIVATPEDFGAQGAWPTHPKLLDWLAVDFQDTGWDLKALQKKIVLSATYRQRSRAGNELLESDPDNRLLARGPRFRLDAESIRDNALAISGLLRDDIGGPSVRPYQPPGLWKEVAYGASFTAQVFKQDEGDALYRRSMYTFWKRQSPPPGMMIFDAPNREACTVQRSRSNTPLQALALLNDPQYVEAARFLAERMLKETGETPEERLAYAFQLATARTPSQVEQEVLLGIYESQMQRFSEDTDSAKAYLSVGDAPYDASLAPEELAAWSTVASMILNLDETITKG